MYRDHQKGPGGPSGGATYPGGPRGLKREGNQPEVGWCAPPWPPLRLGLETLDGFGRPHPLGNLPPKPGGAAALGGAPPPLLVT